MEKLQPKLRFSEFEGDWIFKFGNELFEPISDKNHKSDLPILAISQEFGAIPRDLIDYKISVTDKSIDSYKIVRKGNFIISLRSFQGGIEYSNYEGICSPAYIILGSTLKMEDVFYKYYLKTDSYILKLQSKLEGIRDGKMISFKYFSEIKLPYPNIGEQQKIAQFLTQVDNKINQLTQKQTLLEQYKKGIMQQLFTQKLRFKDDNGKDYPDWKDRKLKDVLFEHGKRSKGSEQVHSVSVHKGIINQIEHLGRSFSAKDTSNYNLVKYGDIVYTKSPTGDFPYGIIKQSQISNDVIVSPLYGVFTPETYHLGYILNTYFESNLNVYNYLASIIQKGAKNTINITNKTFLSKSLKLPVDKEEQTKIANFLSAIDNKINQVNTQLEKTKTFKKGLLQQMFV